MRLVDCYIDTLLFTRALSERIAVENLSYEELHETYLKLLSDAEITATKKGHNADTFHAGKFAVVAFIDEIILCSAWPNKSAWQKMPLQRKFFDTTNIGAEFYDHLNQLSKHGPDKEVREVFSLCLGLGFKGKYFSLDDRPKYEEVKAFNLGVLLPDEAKGNIDKTILFPLAYGESAFNGKGSFIPRLNVLPAVIGVPLGVFVATVVVYHYMMGSQMDAIISAVKF
ncbi:MAG: DotU family type IV/VI secretion system protein [Ectothiorhodospiraceae bacterium]|nr:DotU family type IV/VI secretion system protein [Ectothiorhodospiraceae bacterium]